MDSPSTLGELQGQLSFKCTDPKSSSESPLYFLTKKQYTNTLIDLLGSTIVNSATVELSLVPDEVFDHYSHQRLSGPSKQSIQAYQRVATKIASTVQNNTNFFNQIFGNCNQGTTCLNLYFNNLGKRIFRRPLSDSEKLDAQSFLGKGLDYKEDLALILSYHLQAPTFIFRLELGAGSGGAPFFGLSSFEVASRISYMATDSTPDAQLLGKAEDGSLMDLSVMRSEVRRLLNTTRGKDKLISTISAWAGMDQFEDVSILPSMLLNQHYANGLEQAMIGEARTFIEYIVYEYQGTYYDLLTSKASFASDPALAKIYQHAPISPNRTPGNPGATMSGRRQGLLLRAPALTSAVPRVSAIHRGVEFQGNILCNELPSPPPSVFDMRFDNVFSPTERLEKTSREAVTYQTSDSTCMSCHSSINPTGFAFENFGPFGELRSDEQIFDDSNGFHQSLPIDASGDVPTWNSQTIAVNDAFDLVGQVAVSPEGHACFARKMFRSLNEKREGDQDDCQLKAAYEEAIKADGSLLEVFVNLIANEANQYKVQ